MNSTCMGGVLILILGSRQLCFNFFFVIFYWIQIYKNVQVSKWNARKLFFMKDSDRCTFTHHDNVAILNVSKL